MAFSGCIALRVIHTSTRSCDTAAAIRTIQVRVLTRNVLDVSILQYNPKNIASVYTIFIYIHISTWYIHGYPVIRMAGLRYVPFFLYVVLLAVIHRSSVVTVYQRTTNCEYCQSMGQHRIVHIRSELPRPNWVCRGTHLWPPFLYASWDNLTGPIPAPHATCFVIRSDEPLNSKDGRSATGAERPTLNSSYLLQQVFDVACRNETLRNTLR